MKLNLEIGPRHLYYTAQHLRTDPVGFIKGCFKVEMSLKLVVGCNQECFMQFILPINFKLPTANKSYWIDKILLVRL
jgi:hypothetical protein